MALSRRVRRRLLRAETKSIAAPVSPRAPCPRVPGCISALLLACPRWRHRSLPLGTQPGGQCWVVGRGLRSSVSRIMAHLCCTRQGGQELLIPVSGPCLRARRTWGPGDLGTWVSAQPARVGRAGEGRPKVPRVWGAWYRSGEWEGAGGRAWGVGMVVGGVPGEPPSTGALKLEGSSRSPSCSPPGINVGALLPRGTAQGEQRGTTYCGQALVFRQCRDVSLPQDVSGPLTSSCTEVPPKGAVEHGVYCPQTASLESTSLWGHV